MKNVFLSVAALLIGIATFSQNTWQFNAENKEIQIPYTPYGMEDDAMVSIQWQAGCRSALTDAVEKFTGNSNWIPQIGQGFHIRISGVASNTGNLVTVIADEREEADWYALLSKTYHQIQITKGEPFVLEGTIFIDNVTRTQMGREVADGLIGAGLVLVYTYDGQSTDEGFNKAEPFTISEATMEILFSDKVAIENPIIAIYEKQSENLNSYQYQSATKSNVTFENIYDGAFVNVEFTGTALSDVDKLMYMLAEKSQPGNIQYFSPAAYDVVTIAENIQSGDLVNYHFSYPLNKKDYLNYNDHGIIFPEYFVDCIMAESSEKAFALYFENANISVDITNKPKYQIPESIILDDDIIISEDEIIVESERSEALFTMPINEGADSYTLTIKNNGEIVCSLTFNAQGQLANIDFSNTASYELKSDVLAYQFTVTGLSEGTSYGYNFKALDNNKIVLKEYEGEFTTKEGVQTGEENQGSDECGTTDDKVDGVSTAISEVSNASLITIANRQILVNEEVPAFVVTVSGQKIANANLKAGVYFVTIEGKTVGVSIR